jgi:hypothetical protein
MFYMKNPVITYSVTVNLKVEGRSSVPASKVCEIRAEYVYDHLDINKKVAVNRMILGRKVINSNDPGIGTFTDYTITYNLDQAIENLKAADANKLAGFNDTKGTYGINIVVDYFGQRKIYIDYIEIYDTEIGAKIRNNPKQVEKEILSFVNRQSTLKNVRYYYGLDEPQSLDNYYPFEFVNNVLKKNEKAPLITTFYPYWTGTMNGDDTFERFLSIAKPDQLMFYYYPVLKKRWPASNSSKGSYPLIDTFRKLLHQSHQQNPDFFAMVQCHAFQEKSISDNLWLRQPSPEELNAQVMLALAHGAKGIFFYNFFSNYSHDAILDKKFNRTPLYGKISKDIAPRIKGILGQTLLGLDYTADYIKYQNGDTKKSKAGYIGVSGASPKGEFNYHVGLLKDKKDSNNNYFLIVNLLSAQKERNNSLKLTIRNNLANKYKNIRLRNIEGGLDITFNKSYELTENLEGGNGALYQMTPVVRCGGKLKYNETINGTEELRGALLIEPGVELEVNGIFNVYEDVTLQPGAKLNVSQNGKINYLNSSKLIRPKSVK